MIAEILRASSRPGRCDENFCDGSFCGASVCRLALMFSFVRTTQQQGCIVSGDGPGVQRD